MSDFVILMSELLDVKMTGLKVRCSVDRTWLMVLVQSRSEWSVAIFDRCVKFFRSRIRIIQIIVVKIFVLAPYPPCGESESTKKQSTANTTNYATNNFLGTGTQARATAAGAGPGNQRASHTSTCGNWYNSIGSSSSRNCLSITCHDDLSRDLL